MRKLVAALQVSIISIGILLPAINVSASSDYLISRGEAEQRAIQMIDLKWTYNKTKISNLYLKSSSKVKLPKQLIGKTTSQEVGIPYNWGGSDGIDINSLNQPWENFLEAIEAGAFTGNVNTKAGRSLVSGTAGIDCSGFVQAAFGIEEGKLSTVSMFDKYFQRISYSELKHMDILNHSGSHVVIFDKWGTLNGVQGAYTYESTVNQGLGGIQGTKRYFRSKTTLLKNYKPGRYKYLTDDTKETKLLAPPVATSQKADKVEVVSSTKGKITTPSEISIPKVQTTPTSIVSTPKPIIQKATASSIPTPIIQKAIAISTPKPMVQKMTATSTPKQIVQKITTTSTQNTTPKLQTNKINPVTNEVKTNTTLAKTFAKVSNVKYAVNLRAKASNDSTIKSILPKDTIVYVLAESKEWYQISIDGKTGWVWGKNLTPLKKGEYVTLDKGSMLNIRKDRSMNSNIVGVLEKNQHAKVNYYSENGKWMNVSIGTKTGWVFGKSVSYIA